MSEAELKLRETLEELNKLVDYVQKFNVVLQDIKDGKPIENVDFTEIYIQPESEDMHDILTIVSKLIESVIKTIYSLTDTDKREWSRETRRYRNQVNLCLNWKTHGSDEIGHHKKEDLQFPYMRAIGLYTETVKKYPTLNYGLQSLPDKCPWSLNELMELDFISLKDLMVRRS